MPPAAHRRVTLSAALVALTCAALWGGVAVAIIYTQEVWPPIFTASLRFAMATVFMIPWCLWQREPLLPAAGHWRPAWWLGVMLFAQIGTFHAGLRLTNSSHASVLIGSFPVAVAVLAHFLLPGDRLTWQKSAGMTLAALGVLGVVASSAGAASARDPVTLAGDLVLVTSSLLLAIKTVYTKHAMRPAAQGAGAYVPLRPGTLTLWSNVFGTGLLLAYSLATETIVLSDLTPAALWGLLYQGLAVAGFCFAAFTVLLDRYRASDLAAFSFAQPLFGMLFGALFRGDPLSGGLVVGAAAVAAGILLVTRESAAG